MLESASIFGCLVIPQVAYGPYVTNLHEQGVRSLREMEGKGREDKGAGREGEGEKAVSKIKHSKVQLG